MCRCSVHHSRAHDYWAITRVWVTEMIIGVPVGAQSDVLD
jgi:hypothetical protein